MIHEQFMQRCLYLAQLGEGYVAPNPMVGCVIVKDGKIIGEGCHKMVGQSHAEVNAVESVQDKTQLEGATVYVSLEPCSHFGKTPPCADLLIQLQVKQVVIGCTDSNPKVAGKGIEKLKRSGIEVITGVLEEECKRLNKRFFTSVTKERPYIILKWAQSSDGFIDHQRDVIKERAIISSPSSHVLVHQWRSEEAAILVGTNTVIADDPQLTVRLVDGKNPVRVTFDRNQRIPETAKILDGSATTIVFTDGPYYSTDNCEFIPIDF